MTYRPEDYWDGADGSQPRDWTGADESARWEKIKPFLTGDNVVDFGCGAGRFYLQLKEACKGLYIGLDISSLYLARFKEQHPEAIVWHMDIRADFAISDRDLGFCFTVLEHIPYEDIERVRDTMKAMAKHWVLIEPVVSDEVKARLAPHCFAHNYEELFPVTTKLDLGERLWLFDVHFEEAK